ncbi:uncharacterized protein C8Q71DRAFT_341052 [Rhodofomes roseus]|uniref:Alkylation response protein AidB-like acyl-CoA dehydrogenase n=1 Tax=Rhodofomes roseus TaxID=34475 RepID=A0ABQ8KU89_9APHY|nr:uncharacterized protein C8Q71DRAFT_341052 [Rhodofomes roseus]KAH9841631.1 hypothetical protein C8Q71DRAFT_341052 [Rhodofomes roseus]
MRIEEGFQPTPYTEGHPYHTDPVLPGLLKRVLPSDVFAEIEADLGRFGDEVINTLRPVNKLMGPPKLVQYDNWGRRVDQLQTTEGWRRMKALWQKEGIVGIFYERKHLEHSRIHGFAKILLAMADAQAIDCPLSMTDGSARVCELLGTPELKRDVYPRLISRDPDIAFTAGQWMTERPGGSDVSLTETTATPALGEGVSNRNPYGPKYTLNGFKWFSSATDSDIALALGRTGPLSEGSRSLSLFLVPLHFPILCEPGAPRPSALTNRIFIHRLKDKFGTVALPTAELSLEGTEAYLLGQPGQGVKLIAPVLNITRVHSATSSVGNLRRCLAIATAYSKVRAIRGGRQLLQDTPLHVAELAKVSLVYRALAHMLFGTVALLGKVECGVATEDEANRLRMLTPALKAFAAEKACTAMEECMTALGGAGYMTETEIGRMIQDSLVEKIWEGTITVLSLDVVRAASTPVILDAFVAWVNSVLASCTLDPKVDKALQTSLDMLRSALDDLVAAYAAPIPPLVPRPALFLLSHIACGAFLLEHAVWACKTHDASRAVDADVFKRWVEEGGLTQVIQDVRRARQASHGRLQEDRDLVYGNADGAKLPSRL